MASDLQLSRERRAVGRWKRLGPTQGRPVLGLRASTRPMSRDQFLARPLLIWHASHFPGHTDHGNLFGFPRANTCTHTPDLLMHRESLRQQGPAVLQRLPTEMNKFGHGWKWFGQILHSAKSLF